MRNLRLSELKYSPNYQLINCRAKHTEPTPDALYVPFIPMVQVHTGLKVKTDNLTITFNKA